MVSAWIADDRALNEIALSIADVFTQRGATLVTAESCTGGWIAKTLTDVAGSSAWFECGVVAYSYEAKEALLGRSRRGPWSRPEGSGACPGPDKPGRQGRVPAGAFEDTGPLRRERRSR